MTIRQSAFAARRACRLSGQSLLTGSTSAQPVLTSCPMDFLQFPLGGVSGGPGYGSAISD